MEFWDGGYSGTLDLDLGKKVGNLEFWGGILELQIWTYEKKLEIWNFGMGGVFWNFGFGLRKKSWKFGFLGWGGILELRIWT